MTVNQFLSDVATVAMNHKDKDDDNVKLVTNMKTTTTTTQQLPLAEGNADNTTKTKTTSAFRRDLPFSPAARAFFAALDDGESLLSSSSSSKNNHKKVASPSSSSSSLVQKRIQTLGWRNRYSQRDYYPVTVNNINFSVHQVQRGEVEGTYGTGATVWPAAMVLLKYLEKHAKQLLQGRRCVDLGSGTGITAFAAALLGCREVVCTDGQPNVVQLARDNLHHVVEEMNSTVQTMTTVVCADPSPGDQTTTRKNSDGSIVLLGCPIHVQKYWWGGTDTLPGGNQADVVLVADCVLPKLYPLGPLVEAIDELLGTSPTAVAILSYEYRYFAAFDPKTEFTRLCTERQLAVQTIPLTQQDDIYSVEDIEIWHVQRCQSTS